MISDLDLIQSQLSPDLNGGWIGQNQQANQGLATIAMLQRLQGQQPRIQYPSLPQNSSAPDMRPSFVGIDEYGRGESYAGSQLLKRDIGYNTGLSPTQIAAMAAQSQQAKGTPTATYGNIPDVNVATLQTQASPQIGAIANQLQFAVNPDLQKRLNAAQISGQPSGINLGQLPAVNPDDLFGHPAFQGLQNQHPEIANQVYQKLVPGGDLKVDFAEHTKRRVASENFAADIIQSKIKNNRLWQDATGNWKEMIEQPDQLGQVQKAVVDITPQTAMLLAAARKRGSLGIPMLPTPDEQFGKQNPNIPSSLVPKVRQYLKDNPTVNPKVALAAYLQSSKPMVTTQKQPFTAMDVLRVLGQRNVDAAAMGASLSPEF